MSKSKGKMVQRLKRLAGRVLLAWLGLWLAGIVLFAFLPVPFSAVMVEEYCCLTRHYAVVIQKMRYADAP